MEIIGMAHQCVPKSLAAGYNIAMQHVIIDFSYAIQYIYPFQSLPLLMILSSASTSDPPTYLPDEQVGSTAGETQFDHTSHTHNLEMRLHFYKLSYMVIAKCYEGAGGSG